MTGLPTTVPYGVDATATVTVMNGDLPVDGVVELRRGSTVLASQATSGGTAQISIAGAKWVAGSNDIRAAFVGETTPLRPRTGASVAVTKAVTSSVSTVAAHPRALHLARDVDRQGQRAQRPQPHR